MSDRGVALMMYNALVYIYLIVCNNIIYAYNIITKKV